MDQESKKIVQLEKQMQQLAIKIRTLQDLQQEIENPISIAAKQRDIELPRVSRKNRRQKK